MGSQRVHRDLAIKQPQLVNNVVIVSGEQWRDSAIHIYVPILDT